MTQERPPLTFEDGLARIVGKLPGGHAQLAAIAGRATSTCYDWVNPSLAETSAPIHCAVKLDIAYLEAGGREPPLLAAYQYQLKIAFDQRFADQLELARRSVDVVREGGEGHAAIVAATLPDAGPEARRHARQQLREARAAIDEVLPLLDDRPPPDTS